MKHQATPYLTFSGQARQALEYYRNVFHGEIQGLQTFGEADFETPEEASDHIMHARLKYEGLLLMVSDSFPGQQVSPGNQISLALELDSQEEIQELYDRFTEEGSAVMELQDTFWGAIYAKVKDPFGVIWDLNYTKQSS
ncbi:VOC family protein [Halobacillus salinarum]|uniref:VOC family protein n=1 Tax=Halobacillus salinarum TaxID=2932257 RepID=A0ABY4ENN5_9BACI|nr:VOC family protein [Halobacillus salinarum]UOQ45990.1 VOC family protein [Halobacillus salinarum]